MAEMTQIILTRKRLVEAGQLPITTAFVLVGQPRTEAGIIGLGVSLGSHLAEEEAGGVVAGAALGGIRGGAERPGEAAVDHRTAEAHGGPPRPHLWL